MNSKYSIGIIGYGKMGSEIFSYLLPYSLDITLYTSSMEKLSAAKKKHERLRRRLSKRAIQDISNLECVTDLAKFQNCDIIIESIKEDFDLKCSLFREIGQYLHEDSILTTNTSSISINAFKNNVRHFENFCGLHFFYPVKLINLLEIIQSEKTSSITIEKIQDFAKHINMEHIIVQDAPASVINFILSFYYMEAIYILQEGITTPSKIDQIAKSSFYVGPCESMDIIGLDFFMHSMQRVTANSKIIDFSDREVWDEPFLLYKLLKQGRSGRNSGAGIFYYQESEKLEDDLSFYAQGMLNRTVSEDDIADRLFYSILNGCLAAINNDLCSANDLDKGIKNILFMDQGPISFIRTQKYEQVQSNFAQLANKYGQRFFVHKNLAT